MQNLFLLFYTVIMYRCFASLALINCFNEFHSCCELHPPIRLLSTQLASIKIINILNGGQKAWWICLKGRTEGINIECRNMWKKKQSEKVSGMTIVLFKHSNKYHFKQYSMEIPNTTVPIA